PGRRASCCGRGQLRAPGGFLPRAFAGHGRGTGGRLARTAVPDWASAEARRPGRPRALARWLAALAAQLSS
nr:hypothetical protein [Tanacetum cinerariifolium]